MISKLTGYLDTLAQDWVILDVNGVGYHVYISASSYNFLANLIGEKISLYIEPVLRNEQTHLFGFLSLLERSWFRLLTSIQGVGPKVALAIQGVLTPEGLDQSLTFQDDQHFRQAEGVGPKLALRIVTELKNKRPPIEFVQQSNHTNLNESLEIYHKESEEIIPSSPKKSKKSDLNTPKNAQTSPKNNLMMDALLALTSLGYTKAEAAQALKNVAVGDDNITLNDLIKTALASLAPPSR